MRVLLDECVPRRLARELPGHDVSTVPQQGWAARRNSELLELMAAAGFDVFVTVDRNLAFQQDIATAPVAVIVLHARSNRFDALVPLVPKLREELTRVSAGSVTDVAL
jgi:predicted nuclease of predicted toxin-antitoxin system